MIPTPTLPSLLVGTNFTRASEPTLFMESITLVDVRDLVKVARGNTAESCKM